MVRCGQNSGLGKYRATEISFDFNLHQNKSLLHPEEILYWGKSYFMGIIRSQRPSLVTFKLYILMAPIELKLNFPFQ